MKRRAEGARSKARGELSARPFDPTFSEWSYGFREGRSAHDAVRAAQGYVLEGKSWVVDIDLEKFFDQLNHDILMVRIAKAIRDKRVLRLQITLAPESLAKFKTKVRELWRRGQSLTSPALRDQWASWLRGWWEYYRLAEQRDELFALEGWIRATYPEVFLAAVG